MFDAELRMMSSLHLDLYAANRHKLVDLLSDLFMAQNVMVAVALRAIKCAKLAIHIADIGVVDVSLHDVGDDLIAALIVGVHFRQVPPMVRQRAELLQRQLIQFKCFLSSNSLASENLIYDRRFLNPSVH